MFLPQAYSALPIETFSVPMPSTPHSILSPGESAATPAGVPVMMMSPAPSETCCDSCQMISGTLQISSVRSPFCRSVPLTESQILPFAGCPILEAGCTAEQGAEWSNDLPTSHGRSFWNVEAAALHRDDQFDLVVQVLGQRRVGDGGAFRLQHVGVLGEEERRRAFVISHLADVFEIIAPDAPDAADWKGFGVAGDGERSLRRGRNNEGSSVHGRSRRVADENCENSSTRLR